MEKFDQIAACHFGWISPNLEIFKLMKGRVIEFDCYYRTHRTAVLLVKCPIQEFGIVLHNCSVLSLQVESVISEMFLCNAESDGKFSLEDSKAKLHIKFNGGRLLQSNDLKNWQPPV